MGTNESRGALPPISKMTLADLGPQTVSATGLAGIMATGTMTPATLSTALSLGSLNTNDNGIILSNGETAGLNTVAVAVDRMPKAALQRSGSTMLPALPSSKGPMLS